MKIRKIYFLALSVLGLGVAACSDDTTELDESSYTDALVSAFNLADNSNVMDDLSSVYFTINQYGEPDKDGNLVGQIYNADSLPYGTRVDSLYAEISFSSPKSVTLYTATDTTEYSSTDSINFTRPVLMKVIAANGVNTKYYTIKVNVHQTIGDTIEWKQTVSNPLANAGTLRQQKAVPFNGSMYWYIENQNGYAVYTSALTNLNTWTAGTLQASGTAALGDLNTTKIFNNALYTVGSAGNLLVSANGTSWSAANNGYVFTNLIGTLDGVNGKASRLLGIIKENGVYYFASSTNGTTWSKEDEVPSTFPVSGFSDPIQYFGGTTQRITIVGGMTASGTLSNATWSYDGINPWANLTENMSYIPAMQGASLIPYATDPRYPDTIWMLFAGETSTTGTDTYSSSIYYSSNKGVSWSAASKAMAFPADYTARAFASVYVNSEYYIYILGGTATSGDLNQIWRGRLNQLGFTPVE